MPVRKQNNPPPAAQHQHGPKEDKSRNSESEFHRKIEQYAALHPQYRNTTEKNMEALRLGVNTDPFLFASIQKHFVR
jgi:hypothetical protein